MTANENTDSPWTLQDALIALMVSTSVSDTQVRTLELLSIDRVVGHLPIFADYDVDRITLISQTVFDILFGLVRVAMPEKFNETAYALCCDVAAADGRLREGELRFLEEIRYVLNIDRLAGAAIERAARARHLKV